jgi:AcrR family transcriptional regulator
MSPHVEAVGTRPRVEGLRETEILEATLEVLSDVGYDRLTMDAVAQRAKASKATLYRRWNGKVSLVIDALHHHHQEAPAAPVDTGSLRGDLIASYCGVGGLTDKPEVAAFGAILTAIVRDPEFAAAFRRDVIAPKLAASMDLFERAKERGEVGPDVDIELLAPALAGIVMHRLILVGEVPTRDIVVSVIDQIILPAATATATAAATATGQSISQQRTSHG